MGFSRSSHFFNKIVLKHLEDVPSTKVEIDDTLTEGTDTDDTIDSLSPPRKV